MKKILYIGGSIIVIAFVILIIYYGTFTDSVNIGNFSLKEQLNIDLIDKYSISKGEEKKQTENRIKEMVIRDMKMDEWSKYLEDIKMNTYSLDITGDTDNELLISLNLSKNLGVIGIYKLEGENYLLSNKVENLTNVENIEVKDNKYTKQRFLVIEEFLDERVGAYFTDRFTRIFIEVDDQFEEVFRQSKNYESYYYERWIDPSKESSKWYKLNENSIIEYDSKNDGEVIINVHRVLKKSQGIDGTANKIPVKFKEVEKKDFDIKYLWSEEYKMFIIDKGKIIATGEEVAILEDTSKTVDYLLNLGDKYYKVINKNMKIKHIKEDEININKDK